MKVDLLAENIIAGLEAYAEEVEEKVKTMIEEGAEEIMLNLKKHPSIPERTGKYRKSFFIKKIKDGDGYILVKIANKKYQLTHLLEKPHINRDGTTKSKAFPHWRDAQADAEKLAEKISKELSL